MKIFRSVSAAFVAVAMAWAGSTLAGSTLATKSALHPIVDPQSGYLIGGSRNGKWIGDKETAKSLTGGEAYRVLGFSTQIGETTGSKSRTGEAPCSETHWVRLGKNFNGQIAVGANWNPALRHVRVQDTNQKFYRDEVARILRERGLRKSKIVITQLWRVDLDGDGAEEVLLTAFHYRGQKAGPNNISSSALAGDYAMVLLRKFVNGKVHTTLLQYQFYKQDASFSAPDVYSLAVVADLNGDGKMEVVVRGRYYEGDWMSVYEVAAASVKEVLSSGCGA